MSRKDILKGLFKIFSIVDIKITFLYNSTKNNETDMRMYCEF